MFIFAPFLKIKPIQFLMLALGMFLRIPFVLMLMVLLPFVIYTLNATTLSDVPWAKIVGDKIGEWFSVFFQGTLFEFGIPLSFQQNGLPQTIVLIALIASLLSFLTDYFLRDYGEKIAKKLRTDIAAKFLSIPYASTAQVDAGFLSSVMGTDTRDSQQTFTRLSSAILNEGLSSFVFVLWLIFLDYQLFILFLTVLIPAVLILTKTGRILKRLSKRGLELESDLLSGLLERMRGWQTIKIYKAISFELKNFDLINEKIFHTWRRATRAKALSSPLVEWIGIIAASLIAVIALRRVASGEISNAILMSFVVTIGLLGDRINRIAEQVTSAKKGIESLRRIHSFISADLGDRNLIHSASSQQDVEDLSVLEIDNLSVQNAAHTVLIEKLSGIFPKGSFVVLSGPSGIGKTTFLNVLLGLQNQTVGHILFNHQQVNESTYLKFSSKIGLVPQDPHIFQGSLLDNIFYPQKILNPTPEQMQKAGRAMKLAQLDLNLGADIAGLSGGEKQRLMFARLFFNEPQFIVIDEGTSALDVSNETKILQNLHHVMKESIIFMVSHRSTAKEFATHVIDFSKYKNTLSTEPN